ncbi:MAG: response regulator transcription factor [Prolixibacteraceae bacterium]
MTKVLYVEDEPSLGRIVKESLQSRGFEVIMITDGKDVLDAFRKMEPDICVLDIMLPTKDGYALAGEIRSVSPDTPLIFVTAKTKTEDLLKGFESGGNDYLRKPFSMEELIARMNNLLNLVQLKKQAPANLIDVGRYEFDPQRYELRLKGIVRKLSHREATLLKMLSDKRNSLVYRKDILLRLWGDDSFFNSRNLDVYITRLRSYLKDDPTIEIMTVKGIGYHFAV